MVSVTLKLLSRSLVLISVIFITSLPRFFRGVCSSPRKIEDPRRLKMYITLNFPQFDLPQKYGDLNSVLNIQAWSTSRVLRRAKFLDAKFFDGAGDVRGIKNRDSHPIGIPTSISTPPTTAILTSTPSEPTDTLSTTGEETLTALTSILRPPIPPTLFPTRVTQSTPSSQSSRNTLANEHNPSKNSATSTDTKHILPTTPLTTNGGDSLKLSASPSISPTTSGLKETPPPVTPNPKQVDKHPDKISLRVGATVGGVLGGLVLVSLVGACICISRRRRKGRRGNRTASSRSSHNSFGPVEWHAGLDDTSHLPEVEKNEDLSYRNRDSDHFGSGVESNFFPRRAITYMRGRRQRFMSYLTRGMAESGVDGDRSASDADEGIPNFGSQITLIDDRTQQLETQEQVRQDSVNSPVSRPPTYRSSPSRYSFDINNPILRPPTYHSSPSRYSLDTTAFVMHRISLPSVEMNSVIKT